MKKKKISVCIFSKIECLSRLKKKEIKKIK